MANILPSGPSKKMTIIISDNMISCVANGNEYPLGHPFSFVYRCIKYNCKCYSDGSWECPSDRAEYKCEYEPGRNFTRVETVKCEFFRLSAYSTFENV